MEKIQQQFKSRIRTPSRQRLKQHFPEWLNLEDLLADVEKLGRLEILGLSESKHYSLPLYAMSFGSTDPKAPVLGLFGGVHGLERIGTQVAMTLIQSLTHLMLWDDLTQKALEKIRIVAMPMINPLGIYYKTRANPRGVDLMRNSPIDSETSATFLVGGHRISSRLPWYRGGQQLEVENQALLDFCKKSFFDSQAVITVDFHSGFGIKDRIWFPFAKSKKPFPHLPQMFQLKTNFDRTYPHNVYQIEPQAKNYTTHGDMWDYIYELYLAHNKNGTFLPTALEMGSWLWVKKNPMQIFSSLGPFNPLLPHRQKRILRRHLTLFDFLIRSLVANEFWTQMSLEQYNKNKSQAMELWYE